MVVVCLFLECKSDGAQSLTETEMKKKDLNFYRNVLPRYTTFDGQ